MIGIITFNQDTFTNPTLYSIIYKLNKLNIPVCVFCSYQESPIPEELPLTFYVDAPGANILPRRPSNIFNYFKIFLKLIFYIKSKEIKNLIAIDPSGLILTGRVKFFLPKIKIHYCSFEIFFEDEIKQYSGMVNLKKKEIFYTKQVTSIIIQDNERQKLLKEENKIDNNFKNWHLIPVSPLPNTKTQKKYTKMDFGLNEVDTVYIHSGSIAEWAGINFIIKTIEMGLPKNTIILIHNKTKFDYNNPLHFKLKELSLSNTGLLLHDEPYESYPEYCNFLKTFDYGLVLYQSDGGIYTGMNIKEIGLSSGKFSTYMSLGLPCLLSDCRTYKKLNDKYKVGAIVSENEDTFYHISNHSLHDISGENCTNMYHSILNPDSKIDKFIKHELS